MINGERSSLSFCLQPVDQLNENDFELNYSETLNCAQQIWKGGLLRTSLLESFSNVLSKCTTIICLSQQKENEMYFEEEEEVIHAYYVMNVVMILIYLEKSTFTAFSGKYYGKTEES